MLETESIPGSNPKDFQSGVTGGAGMQEAANLVFETTDKLLSIIGLGIPKAFKDGTQGLLNVFKTYDDTIYELQTKYFGGGREFDRNIREALTLSTDGIVKMGGSLGDTKEIMSDITSTLQRNFILQGDAYSDIYASSVLIAGSTDKAAVMSEKLIGDFKDLGFSVFEIGENTSKILNYTKSLGVNIDAVYSQINKNVAVLNTYNFSDGVYGMSKMAAQAAMLRIDMTNTLTIAEKLFKPEYAIELSAAFQRLGVQVTDLLDPLTLMDISLNDPARLQSSILEMTKSLTYFDEKNQKISILPGEQRRLRELADAMGMNTGELAKMAINAGELEEKFKRFRVPEFVPEDQQESVKNLIANLGELKDGKLMISIPGVEGMVDASQLNEEQLKALEKQAQESGKSSQQLQIEANGALNQINNNIKAFLGAASRGVAGGINQESINEILKQGDERLKKTTSGILDIFKGSGIITKERSDLLEKGDYSKFFKDITENASEQLKSGNYIEKLMKFFTKMGIKVDDALILKDGNVIVPSEDDAIIATKNQEAAKNFSVPTQTNNSITNIIETLTPQITNPETTLKPMMSQTVLPPTTVQSTSLTKGEVSGTITLKIDAPMGMDLSKLQEYLNNPVNMSNIASQLVPILSDMKKNEIMAFS